MSNASSLFAKSAETVMLFADAGVANNGTAIVGDVSHSCEDLDAL